MENECIHPLTESWITAAKKQKQKNLNIECIKSKVLVYAILKKKKKTPRIASIVAGEIIILILLWKTFFDQYLLPRIQAVNWRNSFSVNKSITDMLYEKWSTCWQYAEKCFDGAPSCHGFPTEEGHHKIWFSHYGDCGDEKDNLYFSSHSGQKVPCVAIFLGREVISNVTSGV